MKKIVFFILASCFITAAITGCKNQPATEADTPETTAEQDIPAVITYQLLKEYPHDAGAYTQGLIWQGKHFLESAGQYGESNIRKVDLATGKVLQEQPNEAAVFGEGITLLNNKLYQLTWQNKLAYVYDAQTLKKVGEFPLNTEGWGLTNNGTELIVSDGSSNLYFLDPNTFQERRRVGVSDNMGPRGNINELEFINGFVYANIYQTDYIVKIDPSSGKIVGRADLSDLRAKTGIPPISGEEGAPEVLNGIAYDSANNRIFITGKYWPKLFEIKLDN